MRLTTLAVIFAAAVGLLIWAAIFLLRSQKQRFAAKSGVFLLLAGAVWMLSSAFELTATDVQTALIWDVLGYPGIVSVPPLLLIFILQYIGRENWLNRRNAILLSIVPLITMFLVATNESHGLLWTHAELVSQGRFTSLQRTWGPWFLFYVVYAYVLVFAALGILISALIRGHRAYRWQFIVLVLAIIAPMVGGIADVLGLSPPYLPRSGVAVTALALTSPVVIWGLYRMRIDDIVPIARDRIIEVMGDAVIVLDRQQRIVDLNSSARELFGFEERKALVDQMTAPWLRQDALGKSPSEAILQHEIELTSHSGPGRYDVRISPITDWRGEGAGWVIVLRDVTALQQRSHELSTLLEASQTISSSLDSIRILERIAEQMGQAIDTTSAYICSFEPDTNIATVLAEYIGPGATDAERRSDLGETYMEDGILESAFLDALYTGQHDISQIDDPTLTDEERAHMRKYGAKTVLYIPLHVKGQPIGYAELWESRRRREFTDEEVTLCHGIAQQAAIALQNASLYEELELHSEQLEQLVEARTAELRVANENLMALSRVKNEFISNVSHELRTPITNLKLYHKLLTRNPVNQETYMSVLDRETERLRLLVESLLSLSRLEQDAVRLNLVACDLNALAEIYVDDRRTLAAERNLTLLCKPASPLPPSWADDDQIGQALSVLLTNALNYTPPGGAVIVATHQREVEEKSWVGISVSDNGPGVGSDEQPRLFERFFRGRAALDSGEPGTGLGLAIAHEIVKRHGGSIEAESEGVPGKGVTFTIWLPAIPT